MRLGAREVGPGQLACIEAGSVDLSTAGREDEQPIEPGQGVFYLVEFREVLTGSSSSFGEEQAGRPRVFSGGCS